MHPIILLHEVLHGVPIQPLQREVLSMPSRCRVVRLTLACVCDMTHCSTQKLERTSWLQWPLLSLKHLCPLQWVSGEVTWGLGALCLLCLLSPGVPPPFTTPDFSLLLQVSKLWGIR